MKPQKNSNLWYAMRIRDPIIRKGAVAAIIKQKKGEWQIDEPYYPAKAFTFSETPEGSTYWDEVGESTLELANEPIYDVLPDEYCVKNPTPEGNPEMGELLTELTKSNWAGKSEWYRIKNNKVINGSPSENDTILSYDNWKELVMGKKEEVVEKAKERRYQEGDWIVIEKPCSTSQNEIGAIEKITEIRAGSLADYGECIVVYVGKSYECISAIRIATPEEVRRATGKEEWQVGDVLTKKWLQSVQVYTRDGKPKSMNVTWTVDHKVSLVGQWTKIGNTDSWLAPKDQYPTYPGNEKVEEDIQVGDYVIVTGEEIPHSTQMNKGNNGRHKKGDIIYVSSIGGSDYSCVNKWVYPLGNEPAISINLVRKATEVEIAKLNIPKYKAGDWVCVLDTPNVRKYNKRAIGYTFQLDSKEWEYTVERWEEGEGTSCDPVNKYCVNYKITDIRYATEEEVIATTKPVPEPWSIVTTDGVRVYENERGWWLSDYGKHYSGEAVIRQEYMSSKNESWLLFSTKEAAEEYRRRQCESVKKEYLEYRIGQRVLVHSGANVTGFDGKEGKIVEIDTKALKQPNISVQFSGTSISRIWCYPDTGTIFNVEILSDEPSIQPIVSTEVPSTVKEEVHERKWKIGSKFQPRTGAICTIYPSTKAGYVIIKSPCGNKDGVEWLCKDVDEYWGKEWKPYNPEPIIVTPENVVIGMKVVAIGECAKRGLRSYNRPVDTIGTVVDRYDNGRGVYVEWSDDSKKEWCAYTWGNIALAPEEIEVSITNNSTNKQITNNTKTEQNGNNKESISKDSSYQGISISEPQQETIISGNYLEGTVVIYAQSEYIIRGQVRTGTAVYV